MNYNSKNSLNVSYEFMARIIKQLDNFFSSKREVLAVYLFGSWASGKSKKNSDADVAILLSPSAAKKAFNFQMRWQEDLARILGTNVDLVILNEADPLLKFQVYSKGLPAHIKMSASAEKHKWRAICEYWDWIPSQRILEKTALTRMEKYGS